MINKVVLIGRLTADPELRKTQNGTSVVSYTLAVGRSIKKEGQSEADFINCVAWNKTADLMVDYLHKGSLIGITGRIQTRNYQNEYGNKVYVTEVITDELQFLEPKSDSNGNNAQGYTNTPQSARNGYNQPQYGESLTSQAEQNDVLRLDNDDLPF